MKSYLDKYKGTVEKSTSDFKTKGKKKKTKPTSETELFSREEFEDPDFAPTIVDLKEFRTEEAEKDRIQRLNSKTSEKSAGWKVIDAPKKSRHDSSEDEDEEKSFLETKEPEIQDFGSRRKRRNDTSDEESSEDLSPIRKNRNSTEQIKKRRLDSSDSEKSPERSTKKNISHVKEESPDLSPQRRRRREVDSESDSDSPPRRRRNVSPPHDSRRRFQTPTVVKKGEDNLAGLKTSEELDSHLNLQKEKEMKSFESMHPSETGQFAQTVFRDKEGRIISQEEYEKIHEKKKKKDFVIQKDFEWNGGLVQKQNQQIAEDNFLRTISKPFATHEGEDSDYENELKDQIREGDPMAHLVSKKKKKKKKNQRPEYEGSYLPNRYGIKPGHLWDGVNRSNGFEKKFFQQQSKMIVNKSNDYQDF
eukprot:gene11018-3724_t